MPLAVRAIVAVRTSLALDMIALSNRERRYSEPL